MKSDVRLEIFIDNDLSLEKIKNSTGYGNTVIYKWARGEESMTSMRISKIVSLDYDISLDKLSKYGVYVG